MMWKTHWGTGIMFGLGVDVLAVVAGHPLPGLPACELPILTGYLTAVPDVDHETAKIRYAVPPARSLYVLIRNLVGMRHGLPLPGLVWYDDRTLPRIQWLWTAESKKLMWKWFAHRHFTHSALFAVLFGILLPVTLALLAWVPAALSGLWLQPWRWSFLYVLGASTVLGCLAHCFGDWLTVQGIPFLAPWSWTRYRVPWGIACTTSGVGEERVAYAQLAVITLEFLTLAAWIHATY